MRRMKPVAKRCIGSRPIIQDGIHTATCEHMLRVYRYGCGLGGRVDFQVFIKLLSDLSWKEVLGALVTLLGAFLSSLFVAYKVGKSSMKEAVELAQLRTGIERQRITQLSEETATAKQTISNREMRIAELERQTTKSEADLAILAASRQNDPGIQQHLMLVDELKVRVAKFDQLRGALLGPEEELWRLRGDVPSQEQADGLRKSRVKVLVFANLKGGVGKTTIAANLAAHYALKMGRRVLVIDLDYQGSLTGTMLNAAKNTLGANILADAMLGGEVDGRWLADVPRDLGAILPQTRLVTCGQTFDRFENQTMMRWLIGDITDDVRYRLASLILSADVQNAYDLVIIDAPPRTSLGTINALCSGHALLIPTVLDSLSVDAVGRFLRRMNGLRSYAPALSTVCVIPSLTQESKLRDDEVAALSEVRQSLPNWSGTAHIANSFIRHFPTLAKVAGREIGYISDKRFVRPAFDALGAEITQRVELRL
jgi:cellulose biosynthesis protein BcsQ